MPTEQRNPSQEPSAEFRYVDIRGIDRTQKTIAESSSIRGADAPSRARKVIRTDDVIVSTVRPNLNAVAMIPAELDGQIASTGFCVLRANRELVEPRYLFYRAISPDFVGSLTAKVRGASYPAVSDRDVLDAEIPVPSLPEQRRVVEVLDQADRIRRLRAEADAKADRILPALFLKMFGDPVANPMAWPVKRFERVCESRLGKMLDARQQTGLHPRPYLRNANVYWDRLVLDDVLEMDFDEGDRTEFRLQRGDVLICEGGEVGRCAIWNDELPECYFQKALHRVRPLSEATAPEFIVYLLWALARRGALRDAVSHVTFSHLTGVKLKALLIPVPPTSLQKEFATRVHVFKQSVRGGDTVPRMDTLFASLLHSAFSGALTASWRKSHQTAGEDPDRRANDLRRSVALGERQ